MIFWSDDCLACLCNFPHSVEQHNAEVERARWELEEHMEMLKRECRDDCEDFTEEDGKE